MASLSSRLSGVTPAQPSPIDPGGPPAKVAVNGQFARVRDTEPGEDFPSIPGDAQAKVKSWIGRDEEWTRFVADEPMRHRTAVAVLADRLLVANDWLGPPAPPDRPGFHVRMERQRYDEMRAGKRRTRLPLRISKKDMLSNATLPEVLVPIRIDSEHEGWKLRDTFTWNINDRTVSPDLFARYLVEDMRLPEVPFIKDVTEQIKKQIEDAQVASEFREHLSAPAPFDRDEECEWWQSRKRRKLATPLPVEELDVQVSDDHEMRLVIKLDITQDFLQLVDRFEWDITSPKNSPEEFAAIYAADLGLPGEFETAIAHSIREQIEVYVRSLCLLGYQRGLPVADAEVKAELLPPVENTFRTDVELPPLLLNLSWEEVERNEREREREVRRKRRQTKGRGPTLPDREFARTYRTPVPRPGPPVSAVVDASGQTVFPQPDVAMAYPIQRKGAMPTRPDWQENNPLSMKPKKDVTGQSTPFATNSPPFAAFEKKKPEVVYPAPHEVGLHEVYINGVWHCANCGVPEGIAVGRRKGLTGPNTLCGECGKHYQRTKKNRICAYSTDPDFHQKRAATSKPSKKAKKEVEKNKKPSLPTVIAEAEEPEDDSDHNDDNASDSSTGTTPPPRRHALVIESPNSDTQEPESRRSSPDSAEGGPSMLATSRMTPLVANAPLPSYDAEHARSHKVQSEAPTASVATAPIAPPPSPPEWMQTAAESLKAMHPDDRFEIIPRPRPPDPSIQEWRIRCLDCPGKLYNVGPGESLTNFETHFKNRQHRQNVENRLRP